MTKDIRTAAADEASRIEEDSLVTGKAHFNSASTWSNVHLYLGLPATIISAVAGASAFSQVPNNELWAGTLALIVAAISGVSTFLGASNRAALHQESGNRYLSLKNAARVFREVELLGLEDNQILERLKELDTQRSELSQQSLQPLNYAYKKAIQGIENGEADYKVDKG